MKNWVRLDCLPSVRPVSGAGLRKLAAGQRNGARAVTFTRVNHTPSVKHMTLLPTREVYRLVPDLERHTANSARYISLSVAPKGPGARPFSFLSPLGILQMATLRWVA